uniref:Integrase core domain-containing protein n=1 Tax=Amphimedon queenslandica TaxID=400682 RepID=A0A1X7U1E1_AMPQE
MTHSVLPNHLAQASAITALAHRSAHRVRSGIAPICPTLPTPMVQKNHPMCGNRQMQGHLFTLRLRVQQSRVRKSQRLVNPHGSIICQLHTINRRNYKVMAPRSLYHIDGNHKLIRILSIRPTVYYTCLLFCMWRLVIHSCIDSYSRRIIYHKCSSNNKAETVFEAFVDGVQQLGLPERVREDREGENIQVAAFMLEHPMRGTGRGIFVTGQYIHNQRIKWLWQDVFSQCTIIFYQLLYDMEDNRIFSIDNESHIFCLHYLYISRINESLQQFLHARNNHPMSSEANLTSTQLWITGLAKYRNQPIEELSEEELVNYGIDWNGPLPSDEEVEIVTVSDTVIPLITDFYDVLHGNVDPLAYSRDYGIDLCLKALQYVA